MSINESVLSGLNKIPAWLREFNEPELAERIMATGHLAGWRKKDNGGFGPANFERGLILTRLVEMLRPSQALEVGTGRGFGCITMADAAARLGVDLKITTLDINPPEAKQTWPIRINGEDKVISASVDEIWRGHISEELRNKITCLTGPTTATMEKLVSEGRKFDIIFIDAGHDAFSVIHDLARSITLLAPGGVILMDDFAPLDEYGLGTCLAIPHARRFFDYVNVFHTEGIVFGYAGNPDFPRAMTLLAGLRQGVEPPGSFTMLAWRIADYMLKYLVKPESFPLKAPAKK